MECSTADHALTDIQDLNIQHNGAAKITLVYINKEKFQRHTKLQKALQRMFCHIFKTISNKNQIEDQK